MAAGNLLDALYDTSFECMMRTLLSEVDIFGLTIFRDGETIKSLPLINVLAAGPNNPFAMLDIVDCTTHLQCGDKNDVLYIVKMILPLIHRMENTRDIRNKKHSGIVDLVLFDGASNVQKAGNMSALHHPRITIGHGAKHGISLFFNDVYTHASIYYMCAYITCVICIFQDVILTIWDVSAVSTVFQCASILPRG